MCECVRVCMYLCAITLVILHKCEFISHLPFFKILSHFSFYPFLHLSPISFTITDNRQLKSKSHQLLVDPVVSGVEAVDVVVGSDAAFLGLLQLQGQQVLHAVLAEHRQGLATEGGSERFCCWCVVFAAVLNRSSSGRKCNFR